MGGNPGLEDGCGGLLHFADSSDWGFAWNWAKRLITKLQSLHCDLDRSGEKLILEALEICSGILNQLNLRIKFGATLDGKVQLRMLGGRNGQTFN